MKTCFKCHRSLPLEDFYPHPKMADGHLNKCKECTKRDVRKHRVDNPEKLSEYERKRYKNRARRETMVKTLRNLRRRCPDKARAWRAVGYAKRTGKLIPKPCEICGTEEKVQAHHRDYSKPLEVNWLCFKCHREKEHGQVVVSK